MTSELWLNLPVLDLDRSRRFYAELGFELVPVPDGVSDMTGVVAGEQKVRLMLVSQPAFRNFVGNEVADARLNNEVLFSLGAASRERVDELARLAEAAGGTVFGRPSERDGWMYGAGFADPDGHRWNVLYMDQERMPPG